MRPNFPDAKFLIINNNAHENDLITSQLKEAGYRAITRTEKPINALSLFDTSKPDLVILDINMPELNGYQVMDQLRGHSSEGDLVPILILTINQDTNTRQTSLDNGAHDFLTKPYHPDELLSRIRILLETRFIVHSLRNKNRLLADNIDARESELERARAEALTVLARAADFKDDDTGAHVERVGIVSEQIARELGFPKEKQDLIRRAAPLHDIGKIGISDKILRKKSGLNRKEWAIMRSHTSIGAKILLGTTSPVFKMAQVIAVSHHEKWSGEGYHGLRQTEIPIEARIVAIADVFDALTHKRSYKDAKSVAESVREIKQQKGRHFDPDVVDAFCKLKHNLLV